MFATFYFHKLEFRISPTSDTTMPGWVGAVLRNNFMYAAESICTGRNTSFRNILDTLSISSEHPLFPELKGSIPKGLYIRPNPNTVSLLDKQEDYVRPSQWLEFSVTVFGRMESYIPAVIDTVESMCARGFGHPMTPFVITGIYSYLPDGNRVPYSEQDPHPIRLFDYQSQEQQTVRLKLSLDTPTDVINVNTFKDAEGMSYQDITSSFPSFYLIAKTALNRIEKLNTIYCDTDPMAHYQEEHNAMLELLKTGCHGVKLSSAEIFRLHTGSTPKKGQSEVIPIVGYVGKLAFSGVPASFIPYLCMAQHIGIGRNVAYGSGSFRLML